MYTVLSMDKCHSLTLAQTCPKYATVLESFSSLYFRGKEIHVLAFTQLILQCKINESALHTLFGIINIFICVHQ